MKRIYTYAILSLLYINYSNGQTKAVRTMNFDNNWLFYLGGYAGGENYSVNDSKWRKIDLPHDWSVEDRPGTKSPFSKNAISQCNEGFTTQGTGWYRKHFLIPKSENGKHVIIQFDGVYMNSIIYVNGKVVGNHPYGYTSFYYDITNKLKFGEKNIIAVQVINEGQNSRWYSGSGIYRHVWLKFTNAVHIVQWSTYITTSKVSIQSASINIKTQVVNENDENVSLNISTRIIDANGLEISKSENKSFLSPNEKKNIGLDFNIINPQLWSCSTPNLYKAYIEIYKNGEIIDKEETSFGIRKITFDVNNGFQLNDTVLKLKGGCFHDDNGPLGSKSYDRAEERKVELLKASGFNAIRCSHNPPSPAFLDACDRLGMLVIDEAFDMWNHAKTPYDYHLYFKDWWQKDLESMVTRDRNHPSIIIWSIGNEIPEKTTQEGVTTANNLAEFVRKIDPTRPVTAAVNDLSANNNPFFASLDLCGYNYAIDQAHLDVYELDHLNFPSRIMFGSESYPLKAFESWKATEEHPFVLGDFVWTAWDYIGEASIGWLGYPQSNSSYPWNLAFCGDIDICGWKRPQSYYRDALWKPNQLSVFVKPPIRSYKENVDKESWSIWNWEDVVNDWNWEGEENRPLDVVVYSSCEEVDLQLNGHSLGIKPTNETTKFRAEWNVPYQAGELKAIGYRNREIVAKSILHTAADVSQIKLTADHTYLKANAEDLSYITVMLSDSKGFINPRATNLVKFTVFGNAKIVGVGNGNPMSLESFQAPQRKAWKGKCLLIIKAGGPGKIVVKAQCTGLKQSEITLFADNH